VVQEAGDWEQEGRRPRLEVPSIYPYLPPRASPYFAAPPVAINTRHARILHHTACARRTLRAHLSRCTSPHAAGRLVPACVPVGRHTAVTFFSTHLS